MARVRVEVDSPARDTPIAPQGGAQVVRARTTTRVYQTVRPRPRAVLATYNLRGSSSRLCGIAAIGRSAAVVGVMDFLSRCFGKPRDVGS